MGAVRLKSRPPCIASSNEAGSWMSPILSKFVPGPWMPMSGVAEAMFEPTVMAQIASWSQGSR